MNIGIVIPGILTLFLSVWAFLVARDPRQWRLWWMSLLGALDYNTPTEIKRRQEGQMAKAAWVM